MPDTRTCHAMRQLIDALIAALRSGRTSREVAIRQMNDWWVPQHVIARIAA